MSKTISYLMYFCIYSLIILFIGKSSFDDSDSVPKFFIGERKTGVLRLFFTFVGTWISAASVLGFTGNVYQNGTAVIMVSVVPWFIGALLLYAMSDRLHEKNALTIPQLIGSHYQSDFLQAATGLLIAVCYVMYLVIQIKGFGIAASSLLNIDYKVAIFLVYLFILYTTFGGFISVSKTDGGNLIMLSVSVVLIYAAVMQQMDGVWFLSNAVVAERLSQIGVETETSGILNGYSLWMYGTTFFGWGMGLAANPQYLIRLMAAKDKKTSRRMLRYALLFLVVFYFCMTEIGLGLKIISPDLAKACDTDNILIYAIDHLLASRFGGFFLISIIGSCISTANSQLLLVSSSLSYDVVGTLRKKAVSEDQMLSFARWFIFIGGTISLFLALDPPENVLFFGADVWGIFAAVLTPLLYGALYCPDASREAAYGAFGVGVIGTLLFRCMDLSVYWAFPATFCSCVVYALISYGDRRGTGC